MGGGAVAVKKSSSRMAYCNRDWNIFTRGSNSQRLETLAARAPSWRAATVRPWPHDVPRAAPQLWQPESKIAIIRDGFTYACVHVLPCLGMQAEVRLVSPPYHKVAPGFSGVCCPCASSTRRRRPTHPRRRSGRRLAVWPIRNSTPSQWSPGIRDQWPCVDPVVALHVLGCVWRPRG